MKDSYEQRVQNQFGGFCARVLKNEANRIHNEYARQRELEKSLDSSSDLPLSSDEYIEMVNAMDAADKQAQAVGCKLMSHDESIRFYAREIASDLERYLLGVFNNGND